MWRSVHLLCFWAFTKRSPSCVYVKICPSSVFWGMHKDISILCLCEDLSVFCVFGHAQRDLHPVSMWRSVRLLCFWACTKRSLSCVYVKICPSSVFLGMHKEISILCLCEDLSILFICGSYVYLVCICVLRSVHLVHVCNLFVLHVFVRSFCLVCMWEICPFSLHVGICSFCLCGCVCFSRFFFILSSVIGFCF